MMAPNLGLVHSGSIPRQIVEVLKQRTKDFYHIEFITGKMKSPKSLKMETDKGAEKTPH
jgi:hypothetical protein